MSDKTDLLAAALQKIARWRGEFPSTGRTWADGSPMSYSACYGSIGERDYMRQVALDALAASAAQTEQPIDMILHCPKCGLQHVDAPDAYDHNEGDGLAGRIQWSNPPHRSHLCHGCGFIWRPADVPTNGVAAIKTIGKNDSVKTVRPSLVDALDLYEAQTEALPLGHEIRGRGYSAYNWQMAAIRDIRALLSAQRQDTPPVSIPVETGIYAWLCESSAALVMVNKRPSKHSRGGVLNGHVMGSTRFYDGCAVEHWTGGKWFGPLTPFRAQREDNDQSAITQKERP